jgi:hypothetical protein
MTDPVMLAEDPGAVLLPPVFIRGTDAALLEAISEGLGRPAWSLVREVIEQYLTGFRGFDAGPDH